MSIKENMTQGEWSREQILSAISNTLGKGIDPKCVGELVETLEMLVERIEYNGGIGEYKGGPSFVMKYTKQALKKAQV